MHSVVRTICPAFHHFAMEMKHMTGAGQFMQVVQILSNDLNIVILLQRSNQTMAIIGFAVHILAS